MQYRILNYIACDNVHEHFIVLHKVITILIVHIISTYKWIKILHPL